MLFTLCYAHHDKMWGKAETNLRKPARETSIRAAGIGTAVLKPKKLCNENKAPGNRTLHRATETYNEPESINIGHSIVNSHVLNFYAGPTALPGPVLDQIQRDLLNFQGTGMSVMEISHRAPEIEFLLADTIERARRLLGLADDFAVLLLQGRRIASVQHDPDEPLSTRRPGGLPGHRLLGTQVHPGSPGHRTRRGPGRRTRRSAARPARVPSAARTRCPAG